MQTSAVVKLSQCNTVRLMWLYAVYISWSIGSGHILALFGSFHSEPERTCDSWKLLVCRNKKTKKKKKQPCCCLTFIFLNPAYSVWVLKRGQLSGVGRRRWGTQSPSTEDRLKRAVRDVFMLLSFTETAMLTKPIKTVREGKKELFSSLQGQKSWMVLFQSRKQSNRLLRGCTALICQIIYVFIQINKRLWD